MTREKNRLETQRNTTTGEKFRKINKNPVEKLGKTLAAP